MKNITQKQGWWHTFWLCLSLIFITVLLIVWFLPRDKEQRFSYDIGKPWMYNSFIAQFDFPIYKTDEALKAEEDSMLAEFQPYYNYKPNVEKTQIEKFFKDNEQQLQSLSADFKSTIIDRLHRLYQAGIMAAPQYNNIAKDSMNMIRVVAGKQAQSMQINCIYSTFTAYETLFHDEVIARQRQILQRCNLNNYIIPNLVYDKERTETERNDMLSGIPMASGMVMSGQKIIDRGDIVDSYTYRVLSSFERESKRRNATATEITTTLIGQCIFVTILVTLFTVYLLLFRRNYFAKTRNITMLYALITLFPIIVAIMVRNTFFNVYVIPFAMLPIFVRVFMDSRTAFISHVTMVLLCAAAVKYQYEFIIIQIVAGLIAIYSLRELSSRSQVFKTAFLVFLGSCVTYFALEMMQTDELPVVDLSMYSYLGFNGILLLLAYPLMYLIERTFGFTSNVTLFELSNTNRGLLLQLSQVAPGTFQHSITVGNLAAEIANQIGANSLLVRTGALYHDIGKMSNPVFFTENQAGVNPHDNISYKESAHIIIGHVVEGVRMAEKAHLPSMITDFIRTHHGTGMTKFFYVKYKNDHPDEDVDTKPFTYPGPNPTTREQAILMMSDTIEAASRSLPEYTEDTISQLVDRLVDAQVDAGYFKECPITFRDIATAKRVAIERLKSIYHTRISYPEEEKKEEQKTPEKKAKKRTFERRLRRK